MNESSYLDEDKGKGSFKYILFFVIFFALGVGLGVFVTKKVLSNNKSDDTQPVVTTNSDVVDITTNVDYKNTIDKLMQTIGSNVEFYDTRGITVDANNKALQAMPNDFKLRLLYKNITKNKQFPTDNINSNRWGAETCSQGFLVAKLTNDDGSEYLSGYCTVNKIPFEEFTTTYKSLFNDTVLDFSQEIIVGNRKCVPSEGEFLCGDINNEISGELTSKFNVIKATINKDKVIQIYERGYLVDTRSNIVNPDDGFDNYYLHSYDSNLYYYELKSSENLTFIHTFKLDDQNNYYYVSTELEKK